MPCPDRLQILDASRWRPRARAHAERVQQWLGPDRVRRAAGHSHPVVDFLFTYYSHRRARLRRWDPGFGVGLREARTWLSDRVGYVEVTAPTGESVVMLDPALLDRRLRQLRTTRALLVATAARPANFGCFGMHEWAMVYRAGEARRHDAFPLRLSPTETDRVVERATIACSHFDAYRFFTEPARPLNTLRPTADTRPAFEQPGCLHATMDLYRHAFTLWPLVGSEVVADCFALAFDVRALDMAASPYDLSALGYRPVPVETPAGRAEYVRRQRAFTERAGPLRNRLIDECDRLLAAAGQPAAGRTAAGQPAAAAAGTAEARTRAPSWRNSP